jgi:aminoglycoside phosphotransferase (APT) family kinase protein
VRLHVGVVLAASICVSACWIEVIRALDGNSLSWAYVFEWPLLCGYGIHMWRRLVREERGQHRAAPPRASDDDDAALEAWNRYLAELHAADATARRSRGAI